MPRGGTSILIATSLAAALVGSGLLASAFFGLQPRSCVENGTDQRLFFTVENRERHQRVVAWLEPGKALCLPRSDRAIFTAFASDRAEEGCPRIAQGGDRLTHFVATDSCRWASHDGG